MSEELLARLSRQRRPMSSALPELYPTVYGTFDCEGALQR